jgi:hypothetical protein
MENVGQGNGIIIDITFPVFGLENKFQCPGIYILCNAGNGYILGNS